MSLGLVENGAIEVAAVPIDTTGAAVAGDWVSFANYTHCDIVILQGAWAAGTPAVTLDQTKDATDSGGDSKTLAMANYWTKTGLTGTTWTKTAITSSTFNLPATANTMTVIPVEASDLDQDNDFDFFQVDIASPGSNADLIAVAYIFSGPRFAQAAPPTPIA